MNEVFGIANYKVRPLFQSAELVRLQLGDDLQDLPLPDHFDGDAGLLSQLHQRLRRQHRFRIFRGELLGLG